MKVCPGRRLEQLEAPALEAQASGPVASAHVKAESASSKVPGLAWGSLLQTSNFFLPWGFLS